MDLQQVIRWIACSALLLSSNWAQALPGQTYVLGQLLQVAPEAAPVTKALQVRDNRILTADGEIWQGRGVNLLDGFGCDSCGCKGCKQPARSKETLIAWANYFLREKGLDWIRIQLSDGNLNVPFAESDVFWQTIEPLIEEVGRWPNKYILFGPRHDPTLDTTDEGPTAATCDAWTTVATAFANKPHVLFEVVGEPGNYSGKRNDVIIANMVDCVQAIRKTGADNLIVVPGPQQWARILQPYVLNPIEDENLAYDIHPYGDKTQVRNWMQACKSLPCIVGEFAYSVNPALAVNMDEAALRELMTIAQELKLPIAGWMGDTICAPVMFAQQGQSNCAFPQQLKPTTWGSLFFQLYKDYPIKP